MTLDRVIGQRQTERPASHIDMKTGRPRLTKRANWYSGPKMVYPSWASGHSWPPMSFSPRAGRNGQQDSPDLMGRDGKGTKLSSAGPARDCNGIITEFEKSDG